MKFYWEVYHKIDIKTIKDQISNDIYLYDIGRVIPGFKYLVRLVAENDKSAILGVAAVAVVMSSAPHITLTDEIELTSIPQDWYYNYQGPHF